MERLAVERHAETGGKFDDRGRPIGTPPRGTAHGTSPRTAAGSSGAAWTMRSAPAAASSSMA